MCGRLMPTMFTPSAGSVLAELHSSAPPAPALYWITVSIALHFFLSTSCWCRADRSDSPPGGKACQYITFLSGQGCADAGTAHVAAASAQAVKNNRFIVEPPSWDPDAAVKPRRAPQGWPGCAR